MTDDLRALLRWAHNQYQAETPSLQHAVEEFDAGGAPEMQPAPRAWVGLNAETMDWRRIACRLDKDGKYVTPVRCAMESMPEYRRTVLRGIVPRLFEVVESVRIATGDLDMPAEAAIDTAERSLRMLRHRVTAAPVPSPRKVGWVDKSEAQQKAEDAA